MLVPLSRLTSACWLTLSIGFIAGCATVINGSTQDVLLASTPSGAKVTIDGTEQGVTPLSTSLKRKDKHTVRLELEGYAPYELAFSRGVSGWIAGNILLGGLIGVAVDAITGSMYVLKPDQVQTTMALPTTALRTGGDDIVVAVVLHADPAWVKVGDLVPAKPAAAHAGVQ